MIMLINCICKRGWPYLESMGGEDLGPVEAQCLIIGGCQGGKLEEQPHRRGMRDRIEGLQRGNWEGR